MKKRELTCAGTNGVRPIVDRNIGKRVHGWHGRNSFLWNSLGFKLVRVPAIIDRPDPVRFALTAHQAADERLTSFTL